MRRAIGVMFAGAMAILSGCASQRDVLRSEINLVGEPSQAREGLVLAAKVLDVEAMKKDSRLVKSVDVTVKRSGATTQQQVPWTLLNPPVFEVRVTNKTGHVVKMTGAVFKLIDAAGNLYDLTSKDKILAGLDDSVVAAQKQGVFLSDTGERQLKSSLRQLKFLDENTQLLPDIADTFFIAFDLPIDPTFEGLNNWLAQQTTLRLKIYEVPTGTNEAGAVTKRVAFEFPIQVKTFKDTYEVGLTGSKLIASKEVQK